jgi:hypothetical protein
MASEKRDLPPHVVEDDESDINMDEKQATWSAIEVARGPPPEWSKDDEGRIRRSTARTGVILKLCTLRIPS